MNVYLQTRFVKSPEMKRAAGFPAARTIRDGTRLERDLGGELHDALAVRRERLAEVCLPGQRVRRRAVRVEAGAHGAHVAEVEDVERLRDELQARAIDEIDVLRDARADLEDVREAVGVAGIARNAV